MRIFVGPITSFSIRPVFCIHQMTNVPDHCTLSISGQSPHHLSYFDLCCALLFQPVPHDGSHQSPNLPYCRPTSHKSLHCTVRGLLPIYCRWALGLISCQSICIRSPVFTAQKRKEVFPPEFRLSKLLLIPLCPFLQHTFTLPHLTSYPCLTSYSCHTSYPHIILYLHITSYLCLVLFHVITPHCLAPHPAISISYKLLTTTPGDYPSPLNHTLRASLGLCFNQALLFASSDLSCTLGISMICLQWLLDFIYLKLIPSILDALHHPVI